MLRECGGFPRWSARRRPRSGTAAFFYSIRPRLERNYSVRLLDEAIEAALDLSPRYMRHLQPDKLMARPTPPPSARKSIDAGKVKTSACRLGHLACGADSRGHGLPRRHRPVQGYRSAAAAADCRPERRDPGRGSPPGPEQRSAQGWIRSPRRCVLSLGPTGVGKTELAKAVAEFLFGDEKKMIRVDMSEYQDGSVAVDKLIGMPRGIVGSERGGVLTNQLKDNPYCVILLDEVEKASPSTLNVFLQAFDEGWITDGRGKRVCPARRHRHHDLKSGRGELPEADQPDGVPEPHGRHRTGGSGVRAPASLRLPPVRCRPCGSGTPSGWSASGFRARFEVMMTMASLR